MSTAAVTTVRTTYREALREALREDPRVFLMGEDVGSYGGCFAVSLGLLEEFGPGVGRVVERPWAVDGMLAMRPTVRLTLSGDHRATDGATGARFLDTLDQLLQHPEEL